MPLRSAWRSQHPSVHSGLYGSLSSVVSDRRCHPSVYKAPNRELKLQSIWWCFCGAPLEPSSGAANIGVRSSCPLPLHSRVSFIGATPSGYMACLHSTKLRTAQDCDPSLLNELSNTSTPHPGPKMVYLQVHLSFFDDVRNDTFGRVHETNWQIALLSKCMDTLIVQL